MLYFREINVITSRVEYQFIKYEELDKYNKEPGTIAELFLEFKKAISAYFHKYLRNDLWWNLISLANIIPEERGTTRILVIQPTCGIECCINIGERNLSSPSFFAGVEWNVNKRGQLSDEGPIPLLGYFQTKII